MARLTELEGVRRRDAIMVDPRKVRIDKNFNVRMFDTPENKAHVEALSISIAQVGVLNPIGVRYENDEVWLVDGESRLRATLLAIERGADIKAIQATTDVSRMDEADRTASLITRNSGKPLTPLEQSMVVARLVGYGWSDEEIVAKTGLSPAYVANLKMLNAAPAGVKKMVRNGKVAATLAIQMIRDHGESKAEEALQKAVDSAEQSGKERATARDVAKTGGKVEKPKRGVPLYYQRSSVNALVTFLVEIAGDTSQDRGLRRKVKNVLENAGVDYKTWGMELE